MAHSGDEKIRTPLCCHLLWTIAMSNHQLFRIQEHPYSAPKLGNTSVLPLLRNTPVLPSTATGHPCMVSWKIVWENKGGKCGWRGTVYSLQEIPEIPGVQAHVTGRHAAPPGPSSHARGKNQRKDIYIEHRAGTAPRLASWRIMTQPGEICLRW